MNLSEAPMVLFTVLAQMSVGAFIVLGLINVIAPLKYDRDTIEASTDPAIYAIGATLVFGLIASMFHMNDVFHVLNVFRNWETSWLSREIIFGILFAALGFVFAIMQWFKLASRTIRQVIAVVTAVAGICLVWSMGKIYMSVAAAPAWNSWIIMIQFFGTALLLGSLAVGAAIATHVGIRAQRSVAPVVAEESAAGRGGVVTKLRRSVDTMTRRRLDDKDFSLTASIERSLAVGAIVVALLMLLSYVFYFLELSGGGPAAQSSAATFLSGWFFIRLVVLIGAVALLALFAHRVTEPEELATPIKLAVLLHLALVLAFVGEIIGRGFHYEALIKLGI